jgi:hypothetical protein
MVHWVRRFFESLYREQILGLLCLAGAIINMPCKQNHELMKSDKRCIPWR